MAAMDPSFAIVQVSTFDGLSGTLCKGRILPSDSNLGSFPLNYCRFDMLNRIIYIINDNNNIDFSYYQPGLPVSLLVQTGPLPGDNPSGLLFYQKYICYFNSTWDTLFMFSNMTPNPETWNEPDYDEIYSNPDAQAGPVLNADWNGSAFNAAHYD
jgi:hypothetical protein